MAGEGRGDGRSSRRAFLRSAARAAAAAALLPACSSKGKPATAVYGPLETTTIRMNINALSCFAPQALAVDLLKEEGFTDVQLLRIPLGEQFERFAQGAFDIHMYPAQQAVRRIDAGDPIVMLGGIHVGCWQVYANDSVQSLTDFRGKTLVTGGPSSPDHALLAATLASVGIDIRTDVRAVITASPFDAVPMFARGEADGIWVLPPLTYQLKERRLGHVVLDSMTDRPWSQYYCCLAAANRNFMAANPNATNRALRALMKATDLVAVDPERGVRRMIELGHIDQTLFSTVVDDLRMMPFNVWRQFEPADTMNFYALRLREAGLVKDTPDQLIGRGTDFRHFNQLRKELKSS